MGEPKDWKPRHFALSPHFSTNMKTIDTTRLPTNKRPSDSSSSQPPKTTKYIKIPPITQPEQLSIAKLESLVSSITNSLKTQDNKKPTPSNNKELSPINSAERHLLDFDIDLIINMSPITSLNTHEFTLFD